MLFKQLLFAASAAAFLVVPEVSEADEDIVNTLPIDVESTDALPSIATAQSVSVPCMQCNGKDTTVEMDFAVEDGSRLTLNGFELYPTADPWHGDLVASVVKANGKQKEQTLGYSLSVKPEAVDMEQRLELVSIQLRIIEVGRKFVDGMPTVKVMLIKAPSGDIVIGSVNVEDVTEKSFDSPLLRIKEKFEKFWNHVKGGCSRHRRPVDEQTAEDKFGGEHPHHGARPWRPDHQQGHHGHHHNHKWGRLMKNIAANILLPVLAGVTAGVGVAVFAMGLCSCVALVFRARRRRCRRAMRRSKAAATEPAIAEEKVGLMESENPPEYKDIQEAQ